jgi:hypothetical protein
MALFPCVICSKKAENHLHEFNLKRPKLFGFFCFCSDECYLKFKEKYNIQDFEEIRD